MAKCSSTMKQSTFALEIEKSITNDNESTWQRMHQGISVVWLQIPTKSHQLKMVANIHFCDMHLCIQLGGIEG